MVRENALPSAFEEGQIAFAEGRTPPTAHIRSPMTPESYATAGFPDGDWHFQNHEVQKGIKGRCETCAPVFKVHASFSELRLVGWD